MTRRQKRFERRKTRRTAKRDLFLNIYDNYNNVCDRTNLFYAADKSKRLVMWKASVQNWSIHQLLNTERLYRDLKAGKDVRKGFSHFTIFERGKKRNISAVRFYERIVQKCLCEKVLYPVYTKSLLYDNGASQQGKGVKFSQDRLIKHLQQHFKRFGNHFTEKFLRINNYCGLLTALLTPTAKKASGLDLKQAKCTRSLFRTLSITP